MWRDLNANAGAGGRNRNGNRNRTREERIKEAVDRVREARTELQKNRNGISVDLINFNIAEDDVIRPNTEIEQTVKISNRGNRMVTFKVQDEIASRRGLEVEGQKEGLLPGNGTYHVLKVKCMPKNIGLMNTIISFEFNFDDSPPFAIVRYISGKFRCLFLFGRNYMMFAIILLH